MSLLNEKVEKLKRLKKAAGQKPITHWKGSEATLDSVIKRLEDQGYEDPGPPPLTEDRRGKEADVSGLAQPFTPRRGGATIIPADQKINVQPARLARGTETESHCKKAVADIRRTKKQKRKIEKQAEKLLSGKGRKKKKKAKIVHNKDGTATKTTTAGNVREIGAELAAKIKKMHADKHRDKRADEENFTVADLAREIGMDAKVARAKLRRHEDKIKKLHSKGQDRWVFPISAKKAVKEILQPKG